MASTQVKPPFRLLDLPPELVGKICEHLTDKDLKHIRCVCRALKIQSTTAYGQRFFDHLIVMLHPISLTTFLEISRHPELSKFVSRVSVSRERLGPSLSKAEGEETHEDLQRSIEKSGLDAVILKEAMLGLKNLRTVRIDTELFFSSSNAADDHPGVECGRTHLFKLSYPVCDYDDWLGHDGCSRVYRLVLEVLEDACLYTRIDLEMSFWSTLGDDSNPVPGHLSLQSPVWKDHASKKTRYVQSMGDMDPDWICDLLLSVSDLHRLDISFPEIRINDGDYRMYHGFSHSFSWPKLARIYLEEFTTTHTTFVNFLVTHQASLEYIWFSGIAFPHGTWSEPLAAISRMPKLKYLFVQKLLERAMYSNSSIPNDILYIEDNNIQVEGVCNVARTTKALCSDLATVMSPHGTVEGRDGELYHYVVDLSRVIVVTLEEMQSADTRQATNMWHPQPWYD